MMVKLKKQLKGHCLFRNGKDLKTKENPNRILTLTKKGTTLLASAKKAKMLVSKEESQKNAKDVKRLEKEIRGVFARARDSGQMDPGHGI